MNTILLHLPGLVLTLGLAILARVTHGFLPKSAADVVGEVVIGLFFGLVLGNFAKLPANLQPGVKFSFTYLLRTAIVLLGAKLSLQMVLATGGKALILIVVLMAVALTLARKLSVAAGISSHLGTLIGVGTAICGNTAITVAAPVIGARDEEVSFAVAANTLMGTLAVFLYPLLGHALGLSDHSFGMWAGTAINDTSQVLAASFAFSPAAGEIATTVKLTRNALMGFVIVGLGLWATEGRETKSGSFSEKLRKSVPGFVIGFLLMSGLNSLGVIQQASAFVGRDLGADFGHISKFLILAALTAVGLTTRFDSMRKIGLTPFLIAAAVSITTSVLSFFAICWFF